MIGIIKIRHFLLPMTKQSILKDESSLDTSILKKFSGMVRSRLAKTMKIRRVPIINFRFDESIEYSENIERLLQDL